MTCKEARKNLLAWLDDEMDEANWLTMAQHLENCPRCQAEVQRMKRIMTMLHVIAKSDGIPPIPERLLQGLTLRFKLMLKAIAVFAVTCIAFLAGWQARSVWFSSLTHEVNPTPAVCSATVSSPTQKSSNRSEFLSLQPNLSIFHKAKFMTPIPTLPPKVHRPIILSGASFAAIRQSNNLPRRFSIPFESFLSEEEEREELESFIAWAEPPPESYASIDSTDLTLLMNPTNSTLSTNLTNLTPYRIFVRVTDTEAQVVRTVHVDTTQPEHIVAEWKEQGM